MRTLFALIATAVIAWVFVLIARPALEHIIYTLEGAIR